MWVDTRAGSERESRLIIIVPLFLPAQHPFTISFPPLWLLILPPWSWGDLLHIREILDFPGGSDSKVSAYSVGDPASIPGSGRSSGERNGNPLQYPCLENPMDGGAWYATVYGVAKSQTQLSDFTFLSFVMNELWDVLSLNNWGRLGSTMFRVCAQESDGLYLNLVPPLTYPMNSVKSLFLKFFVCKNTLQGCCED